MALLLREGGNRVVKQTILNEKVRRIFEIYEEIYNDKNLKKNERMEACHMMNVISAVAGSYEQNTELHCGRLLVSEEWLEPAKYAQMMDFISGYMSLKQENVLYKAKI